MRYIMFIIAFLLTTGPVGNIYGSSASLTAFSVQSPTDDPVFTEYRGVKLGMSNSEVREKLGKSTDESDTEDMFEPENNETARIFYDEEKKVRAMSIVYSGDLSKAPQPKAVIGTNIEARADGGMFKRVEYPDHGFWVSYVKLAGDNPMVMITVQVF